MKIKALTIWQPWASLIIAGAKPYEFRGWSAPRFAQNQLIAIHAGARPTRRDEIADLILRLRGSDAWSTALNKEIALPLLEKWLPNPAVLPLSSVLGTAFLGRPILATAILAEFGAPNDSLRSEHANFAWPLSRITRFEPFIPAKGAQGFWSWDLPA